MEKTLTNARAYDSQVNGCKRFGADIMISFQTNDSKEILDFFMDTKIAKYLHEELGKRLEQNKFNRIDFWGVEWDHLTNDQKADYLSYRGIEFLNDDNRETVKALYYSDSHKYQ